MRTLAPSLSLASEDDAISRVVLEFQEAWRSGRPPLDRFRARFGADDAPYGLAELVMADLRNRFGRGERPAAREYLDRYPELGDEAGRALSLIYEEYCLRAEAGEAVTPSEFCRAYPTWRDSLAAQLDYHRVLSRAVDSIGAPPAFPAPGDRFADYVLGEELGQGAWARVFLALAPELGDKRYALKVSADRGGEPAILGKLDHPNIVPISTKVVDRATGLRGLSMPYRPGLPLDEVIRRLRRRGRPPRRAADLRAMIGADPAARDRGGASPGWSGFPDAGSYPDAVAWVGLKVAQALGHAHALGIYHRDIKPENVLLSGGVGPQLIDFNLATDPADEARAAHRGGTLPYMAPEHLRAFLDPGRWAEVDGRADLFSLGLVLRELLTLETPARPSHHVPLPRAVNAMIQAREAPRPPLRRGVPRALGAIVAKCLAPPPAGRYPSAEDLAEDLGRYLARRPLAHTKNPSAVEVARNAAARNRRALLVASLVAAVAVLGLALLTIRRGAMGNAATPLSLEVLDSAAADEAAGRDAEADAKIGQAVTHVDAVRSFEEAVRRHRGSIALLMGLASAFDRHSCPDDAVRTYDEVLALDPSRIAALAGKANVETRRNRPEEAVRLYDDCIRRASRQAGRVHDDLPAYRVNRARNLIVLGDGANDAEDFARADDYFTRALGDLGAADLGGPKFEFPREFHRAIAKLGLSRAARGSGRRDRSVELLGEAREHAGRARAIRKLPEELEDDLRRADAP